METDVLPATPGFPKAQPISRGALLGGALPSISLPDMLRPNAGPRPPPLLTIMTGWRVGGGACGQQQPRTESRGKQTGLFWDVQHPGASSCMSWEAGLTWTMTQLPQPLRAPAPSFASALGRWMLN